MLLFAGYLIGATAFMQKAMHTCYVILFVPHWHLRRYVHFPQHAQMHLCVLLNYFCSGLRICKLRRALLPPSQMRKMLTPRGAFIANVFSPHGRKRMFTLTTTTKNFGNTCYDIHILKISHNAYCLLQIKQSRRDSCRHNCCALPA